jgi:uncharacterized protein (TIGR03083 family)
MTTSATQRTRPRPPALDRATAYGMAAVEYDRILALLRSLGPDDWTRPTECPGWEVRAMAAHVLGQAEMAVSLRETLRHARVAAQGGVDALTALQVRERADLDGGRIVDRLDAVSARAVRGRSRLARFLGRLPSSEVVGSTREWWQLRYVTDVILTRDTWMHRMDIARATGRQPRLTADHDGLLVADVVAEWAQRHGRPYRLRLTGPAGGEWTSESGGEEIEMDAVDFCRLLSGRGAGEGLLGQQVPF